MSVTGIPFVRVAWLSIGRRSPLLGYVVEHVGVGAGSTGFAVIEG
jgi:hypothetical protein